MAGAIEQLKQAMEACELGALTLPDQIDSLMDEGKAILQEVPTLTPPNEWVSVKDAVPDPGERVLATDGIFVGEAYRSSANSWFRHTGFPWMDGVTGRTVRFWMPMPSSPDRRKPEGEV